MVKSIQIITVLLFLILVACENKPTETKTDELTETKTDEPTLDLTKYPFVGDIDRDGYDSVSNIYCRLQKIYVGQHLVIHPAAYDYYLEQGNHFYKNDSAKIIKYLKKEDILDVEFKVLDCVISKGKEFDFSTYFYLLKLLDKKRQEIFYFKLEDIDPYLPTRNLIKEHKKYFPFIVVGFYEKMQKVLAGQSFVFPEGYYGLKGNKDIINNFGDEWKFVDLKITENRNSYINIILKNKHHQKVSLPYEDVFPLFGIPYLFTYKEFKEYREKFNDSDLKTILSHKVKKGFTKEMVVLSIGEPDDLNYNHRNNSSLWIYRGQKNVLVSFVGSLSFDKEVLTDLKEIKWH